MSWGEWVAVIGLVLPIAIGLWVLAILILAVAVKAIFCGLEDE